ncbi:hypothetical protein CTT30_23360 (plasmid) [Vibrio coralliilyticus]|nr:hypothetical protein CTT30_23360 [Vibrio coralliilyticus]
MNQSLRMLFAITCLVLISIQCMAKTLDAPMDKDVLSELDQANELYLNDAKELKEYYSELKRIANTIGYEHGFQTEMNFIKQKMLSEKSFWNNALSFSRYSNLLSSGPAKGMFLIGGVVDEVDSSIKTVNKDLILLEGKKYIIRRYPSLRISPPHWLDYLFPDMQRKLTTPSQSILPKNDIERDIWKKSIDAGWKNGVRVAQDEYRKNYTLLFADLIGMVRYWRLVETGVIKEVQVLATNHRMSYSKSDDGEELILNPTSVEITEQSTFVVKPQEWSASSNQRPNTSATNTIRDAVIEGDLLLEELTNRDITIFTPEHQQTMEALKNERYNRL